MVDLHELIIAQGELERGMSRDNMDDSRRQEVIVEYIKKLELRECLIMPEFSKGAQWINTSRPLTLKEDLTGKIIVLDFFTYCCINCLHILPDLELLEAEYSIQSGVIVVGVHSGKFDNEKILENVVSAVLRYHIHHPVINDANGELWAKLSIFCWPTLLILGPRGQVLFVVIGEGRRKELFSYVKACTEYYRATGQISGHALPLRLLHSEPLDKLHFPGKVACCPKDNQLLAISDTGHHRIIVLSSEGLVKVIIGGPDAGFIDGSFHQAKFNSPQGIAWRSPDTLFVADTKNHAIRQINFQSQTITTLAGNGQQGKDYEGGKFGREQVLCSPWDVCISTWNSDCQNQDFLIIAMAGSHQLWGYALEDVKLLNEKFLEKGKCISLAGSGREENRNNRYSNKAGFAQPSGVCIAKPNSDAEACIMVADSESSTIRIVDLRTFAVHEVVGGGHDPLDLFRYGDADGIGKAAKLQHPLGVTWSATEKVLYVADSYNHKIKKVNILLRKCETYAGNGKPGNTLGPVSQDVAFNEPGGISISDDMQMLYIADTNNHCIKVIDLVHNIVNELPVRFLERAVVQTNVDVPDAARKKKVTAKPHITINHTPVSATAGESISVLFILGLQPGLKMNHEARSRWHLTILKNSEMTDLSSTGIIDSENCCCDCQIMLPIDAFEDNSDYSLALECTVYICNADGLCHMRILLFLANISFDKMDSQITERGKTSINYTLSLT